MYQTHITPLNSQPSSAPSNSHDNSSQIVIKDQNPRAKPKAHAVGEDTDVSVVMCMR